MVIFNRKSVRWFLLAGCIGVGVALVIGLIKPANPMITLLFWPTSIVGLAEPRGMLEKTVFDAFMFGGNFLLYGAVGVIAAFVTGSRND